MPIKPENRTLYPKDWKGISEAAKARANWRCAHAGCAARQYSVGRWSAAPPIMWEELWHNQLAGYAAAKQRAAEWHFEAYGDGPVPSGYMPIVVIVLTTAHLDHDPTNCAPENLAPMCQRHHLQYDQQHHNETAYTTRMAKRNNLELPL